MPGWFFTWVRCEGQLNMPWQKFYNNYPWENIAVVDGARTLDHRIYLHLVALPTESIE